MTPYTLILTAVILFVAAAAFLAAELFLPSHGLLGVFSFLFAAGGVVALYYANPMMGAIGALALLIIAPATLYYSIKLYPQSPVGKRVMLRAPEGEAAQGFTREAHDMQSLTGKRGVAATVLRPAGTAEIDGRRVDCVSEGEVIPAGAALEVVKVSGMKVIVKAAEGQA